MMEQRWGLTTGSCATATSLAAARLLCGEEESPTVEITLPNGEVHRMEIVEQGIQGDRAFASVHKDGGDDPDITHGAKITAWVSRSSDLGVQFRAGQGVGIVTKEGLQIPVGEAAINPVPRSMIQAHLLPLGPHWIVEIEVEKGAELAAQTFNPRLGIVGGISILGTTGKVRPFSHQSQLCSVRCLVEVAQAAHCEELVLVPGNYGERAAKLRWPELPAESFLEFGNDWGFGLSLLQDVQKIHILGHPGKLAKFLNEDWDTHSSRSDSALIPIQKLWQEFCQIPFPESNTVEGFFKKIEQPQAFAEYLAQALLTKVCDTYHLPLKSMILIDMAGTEIGAAYA